jgi:hypothetical protein
MTKKDLSRETFDELEEIIKSHFSNANEKLIEFEKNRTSEIKGHIEKRYETAYGKISNIFDNIYSNGTFRGKKLETKREDYSTLGLIKKGSESKIEFQHFLEKDEKYKDILSQLGVDNHNSMDSENFWFALGRYVGINFHNDLANGIIPSMSVLEYDVPKYYTFKESFDNLKSLVLNNEEIDETSRNKLRDGFYYQLFSNSYLNPAFASYIDLKNGKLFYFKDFLFTGNVDKRLEWEITEENLDYELEYNEELKEEQLKPIKSQLLETLSEKGYVSRFNKSLEDNPSYLYVDLNQSTQRKVMLAIDLEPKRQEHKLALDRRNLSLDYGITEIIELAEETIDTSYSGSFNLRADTESEKFKSEDFGYSSHIKVSESLSKYLDKNIITENDLTSFKIFQELSDDENKLGHSMVLADKSKSGRWSVHFQKSISLSKTSIYEQFQKYSSLFEVK